MTINVVEQAVTRAEAVLTAVGVNPEGLSSKAASKASAIILKAQAVRPKFHAYVTAKDNMAQAWTDFQAAQDSIQKATAQNKYNSAKRKYSAFSKFETLIQDIQAY